MRMVRTAMMVAALFVGVASAASAQEQQAQGGRPGRGGLSAAAMANITLTPAQQAKKDSIDAKYREQMAALRNSSDDQETRRTKQREMSTKQLDELKALLTDDQKKVFDKNVEEARARMQQRPPTL
jgi:hypothetical protein